MIESSSSAARDADGQAKKPATESTPMEPFETQFPAAPTRSTERCSTVEHNGFRMLVPKRRIHVSAGEHGDLDVYDSSGPQGARPAPGHPARAARGVAPPEARGPARAGNVSQMHYARRGVITEEMALRRRSARA